MGGSSPPSQLPHPRHRMSAHRICWGALVLPLAGLGTVVAVLALPPGDLLLRVYAGLLIGPAASMLVRELLEACDLTPRPSSASLFMIQ